MSSSEEYLDNLLKALTEGENSAGGGASSAPDTTVDRPQTSPAAEEGDKTMSMDDIEAMFSSMGEESAASEETPTADEAVSDGGPVLDELVPEDDTTVEENDMPSDESMIVGEDLPAADDLGPDILGLDDPGPEESEMSEDGALSGESAFGGEEPSIDVGSAGGDWELDGLGLDDLGLEESEAVSGEETTPDDVSQDALGLGEEFGLHDESMTGDTVQEEPSDDLSLDDLGLGELGLEDPGLEELHSEDGAEEHFVLEEDGDSEEHFALEEEGDSEEHFALEEEGDLEEHFALEEEGDSEEHFALEEEGDSEEHFALEEGGEEDADLSALLAGMDGNDDLSEINDLLEKSDQGVAVDDDMMALLDGVPEKEDEDGEFDFFSGEEEEHTPQSEEGEPENIREITPEELAERENPKSKKEKKKEEKERKRQAKLAKKAKKKQAEQGESSDGADTDDLMNLLENIDGAESESKPKKQGFFSKLMELLLEEDDDDESGIEAESDPGDVGVVIGNLSDENKELLAELNAEDQKKAKKKDKKEKKKKDKKGKKKAGAAEAGDAEDEEEDAAKSKKPKKEKKKKKEKEKDIEEEPKVPEKKLSKKKVVSVGLFCATIAACIVVVTMLLPEQFEKQEARVAFDHDQFEQVYGLLYGKKLSGEDETLLHKSSIVLQMQRKLDSYENYVKIDMSLEALDALLEGVSRYRDLRDEADEYNVGGEVSRIYGQILDALANNYGLSESDALDILASGDNVTYTQRLQAIISGEALGAEEDGHPESKPDVLPEEEEIIDRLQGTETE